MEKIKIHLAITDKFDGWDTPFELEMEFPVIEETTERTQHKGEELTLANNVIDTLKNVLGVERVPPEIVKDAFGTLTSIPQSTIDDYVNKLVKFNKEEEEQGSSNNGGGWGEDEDTGEIGFGGGVKSDVNPADDLKKVRSTFSEQYRVARGRWQEKGVQDSVAEEFIRLKAQCRFYEGKGGGKHYLSSLRKSNEMSKDRKILEAMFDRDENTTHANLRECAADARHDKEDWEEWE